MAPEALTPAVWIAARREGHRRAGMAHGREPRLHAAGAFTAEQLAQLEADPVVLVERVGPVAPSEPAAPPAVMAQARRAGRPKPQPLPFGPGEGMELAKRRATLRLNEREL